MRFFNSGVEVAHDGLPVHKALSPPSHFEGANVSKSNDPIDDSQVKTGDFLGGKTESSGGPGLARFSMGGLFGDRLFPTTPSREFETTHLHNTPAHDRALDR